jgi:hypothetical protein
MLRKTDILATIEHEQAREQTSTQPIGPFVLASFARLREAIDTDQGPIEIALQMKEHEEAIQRAGEAEKARYPLRIVLAADATAITAADLDEIDYLAARSPTHDGLDDYAHDRDRTLLPRLAVAYRAQGEDLRLTADAFQREIERTTRLEEDLARARAVNEQAEAVMRQNAEMLAAMERSSDPAMRQLATEIRRRT